MPEDNIEISSSGLRFSYLRFLADGAAGIFVVLLLLLGYYLGLPVGRSGETMRTLSGAGMGHEAKIFLMVLLVVLAVPFGLILNGFGWFIFGRIQTHLVGLWAGHPAGFLTASTSRLWNFECLREVFNIRPANLYAKAQFYESLISAFQPDGLAGTYHVEGLKRLLRSGSVVLLLTIAYYVSVGWLGWACSALGVLFVFLVGLSLLEFYHSLSILSRAYILAFRQPDDVKCVDEEESRVLRNLVQGFEAQRREAKRGTN